MRTRTRSGARTVMVTVFCESRRTMEFPCGGAAVRFPTLFHSPATGREKMSRRLKNQKDLRRDLFIGFDSSNPCFVAPAIGARLNAGRVQPRLQRRPKRFPDFKFGVIPGFFGASKLAPGGDIQRFLEN